MGNTGSEARCRFVPVQVSQNPFPIEIPEMVYWTRSYENAANSFNGRFRSRVAIAGMARLGELQIDWFNHQIGGFRHERTFIEAH